MVRFFCCRISDLHSRRFPRCPCLPRAPACLLHVFFPKGDESVQDEEHLVPSCVLKPLFFRELVG